MYFLLHKTFFKCLEFPVSYHFIVACLPFCYLLEKCPFVISKCIFSSSFQEIICQKNTVSTKQSLWLSSPLTRYSPIVHTSHILCSAENMFFCNVQRVFDTLRFSPRCYKGFSLSQLTFGKRLIFVPQKCKMSNDMVFSYIFGDVFLRWQLFHELQWLHELDLHK